MLAELQGGLTVTLIGMGVVFTLLTLLVYVVQGMSKLARLIEGRPAAAPNAAVPAADEEIVSAISAAISAYRRRHKA